MRYEDRVDAGRRLAQQLTAFASEDVVVLGLPRGGVPVAFEVARALGAPLDVIVVRKLGVPFQPELAMGAIGEGGVRLVNDEVVSAARVTSDEFVAVEQRERDELERRCERFRGDRPAVPLLGRTVIVVDDGVATGSTARAACRVARAQGATRVVLAIPVGPPGVRSTMKPDADEVICLQQPSDFYAVGQVYADFSQTSDAEVSALLSRAAHGIAASDSSEDELPTYDASVVVEAGRHQLPGHLHVPSGAREIVLFAHGSGSSHHSPRNRFVAAALNAVGLGTLLFDLLTVDEEHDRAKVFDIELLAERLTAGTDWLRRQPHGSRARIGYFGASTGAAAALWAAAEPGADIAAVVSRGGRPDLAGPRLALVQAPTLLIVGGDDLQVLQLNRAAQAQLHCPSQLEIVPGATHLFDEPGTLESVARLAGSWFATHVGAVPARP